MRSRLNGFCFVVSSWSLVFLWVLDEFIGMTGMARARWFSLFYYYYHSFILGELGRRHRCRCAHRTCTGFGPGRWVSLWNIIPLTDAWLSGRDPSSFVPVRYSPVLFFPSPWPVMSGIYARVFLPSISFHLCAIGPDLEMIIMISLT